MSIITSSILILLIHFLSKSKRMTGIFGVTSMTVLFICSVLRIVLPIEFPYNNIVIEDTVVYPFIYKYIKYPIFEPYVEFKTSDGFSILHIILLVWLLVSIILFARFALKYRRFIKTVSSYTNLAGKADKKLFNKVKAELGIKRNIELAVIDEYISPMTFGLIKPKVIMPLNDFSEVEKKYIFMHELNHRKNHDTLLKLMIEIYRCIFWWNPLSYLLKSDMDYKLELKCDSRTISNCGDKERMAYLSSMLKSLKIAGAEETPAAALTASPLISSEHTGTSRNEIIIERFKLIIKPPKKKMSAMLTNILTVVIGAVLFLSSYIFIIQPSSHVHEFDEPDVVSYFDESNCYLDPQPDGGYILNFPGDIEEHIYISEDEFNKGYYDSYPVIDK